MSYLRSAPGTGCLDQALEDAVLHVVTEAGPAGIPLRRVTQLLGAPFSPSDIKGALERLACYRKIRLEVDGGAVMAFAAEGRS